MPLIASWTIKSQAERMLSGLMRASVKDVRCVGTTKGCSLNSPPPDQSGPAGIWRAAGARIVSPSAAGVGGASMASVAPAARARL